MLRGDLFILISPTVISAKLKLPKEVSFASPSQPTHSPYPTLTPLFRISRALHFRSASSSRQALLCLLPTNQPTNQPRASLMLLLQISGRLLGCLPAGTIGRCVFPSSSSLSLVTFLSLFFLYHPTFYTSFRRLADAYALSSLHPACLCLHFILRHAPLLSFSFPEDTHSFVTIAKLGGSGRVDGERFFVVRSNLILRHLKILYLASTHYIIFVIKFRLYLHISYDCAKSLLYFDTLIRKCFYIVKITK